MRLPRLIRSIRSFGIILVGISLVGLSFVGCFAAYEVETDHHAVYADTPPPAPQDETSHIGDAPGPEYVWINGYWWWSGARWVWVRGRWGLPPAAGHVYVSPGWVVVEGRYRYVPGRWARRGVVPHYRYVHPPRVYHRPPIRHRR